MRAYLYILARFMTYWGHLPPEAISAVVFAVPGIVGLLAGLPYVLDLVTGGFFTWWVAGLLREHVWLDLPPEHRRLLVALRDLALLKTPQLRPKESPERGRRP